jgi:hypothetical protein
VSRIELASLKHSAGLIALPSFGNCLPMSGFERPIDLLEGRIDSHWVSLGYEVYTSLLVLMEITDPEPRTTVDALLG